MNIGIFGGTFNPPHIGHLIVAEYVRTEVGLDKIIFIPSYITPHKQAGESDLAMERLAMTRLAVKENTAYECSDIEIVKKETSFSIDTLTIVKTQYPNDSLYLIIGMDNYLTFHEWKEPKRILESAVLVIMNRPGYPKRINELIGTNNCRFVDVPNIGISSSDIRRRVKERKSIHHLVPAGVEEYILAKGLFL